jgi:NAD(P)-dependent dehydrogenase (short-subunit alcohol dehydrogenase family)
MNVLFFLISFIVFLICSLFSNWKQSVIQDMNDFEIDFSRIQGKKIIITGGNSGLGFETAKSLAPHGAQLVLACRSVDRCESARQKLLSATPTAMITCLELDLSNLEKVREFVVRYVKRFGSEVDILINNAGMSIGDRYLTIDNMELSMQSNHFGHFYLTSLLFPYLTVNSRIINHSSCMHYWIFAKDSSSFLSNIMSENDYSLAFAYAKSKLANLLFTNELNRRLRQSGNPKNIISIAVHPGFTATNLQTEKFPFWDKINNIFAMDGRHGALSQIFG